MNEKIFGYSLSDAWLAPILGINIYDRKDNNVEGMIWSLSRFATEHPTANQYTLPESVIIQINTILLENQDIFGFEEVEFPFVIDGVINEFFLSCAGQTKSIRAYNLWAFLKNRRDINGNKPEKALKLLAVFNSIKELLIEHGVDSKYLRLDFE